MITLCLQQLGQLGKSSLRCQKYLPAKTSLFPAARAWKHDKRQEKTKGIWPATKESPTQQNRKTDTANRFCPHALALVGTAAAFSH